MLYGRGNQEATIDSLLADARSGQGGALVLRGEAGIGKSALLAYAADTAAPTRGGVDRVDSTDRTADPGFAVLAIGGVEAESTLPYAGLQLVLTAAERLQSGRALADAIDGLPEPQARAVRGALGLRSAEAGSADQLLVALAMVNLLVESAGDRPLLVLVDDAHWLDQESADALTLAARRLGAEPIALLFAVREPHAPTFRAPDLPELWVPELDGGAATRLLDAWHPRLAPSDRDRVLAEASGNPLALRELPAQRAAAPSAGSFTRPGIRSGTDAVSRIFAERLAMLPESTRRALTVAAADDTGSSDILLRAIGRSGGTAADLEPAERDELVHVRDGAVVFGHPLVRSAAYQSASTHVRIEAHRALAAVLDAPDQTDRRAWHRASATVGVDETVATELAQTAERARIRGGSSAAAAAFERAAALSPAWADRITRTIAAARAAADAAAYEHAAELLNSLPNPADVEEVAGGAETVDTAAPERATGAMAGDALPDVAGTTRAAIARVWALLPESFRPRPTHELLVSAALELEDDDTTWREAARAAWTANDFDTLARIASCRDKLPRAGALAAAALGTNRLSRGEYADGIAELRALLATYPEPGDVTVAEPGDDSAAVPSCTPADAVSVLRDGTLRARLLLIVGDILEAQAAAARLEHQARRVGAVSVLPELQVILARCALFLGSLDDARVAASEGRELANDIGQPAPAAELSALLAELAALRGDEETVRSLVTQPLNRGIAPASVHAAAAWSLLDLGLARYESAYDRLNSVLSTGTSMGAPAALPTMVEAAVRAGWPEAARSSLALYERWANNVAQPWATAVLLRCRGLVADDPALLTQAASTDAFPLDRARAELLLGERLRRDRQAIQGRTRLRSALETFERLGATPWAERARSELWATGETRTARERASALAERLTPQELQVARLAAGGASNREIGERLFLSPRTVGYHLAKTYPKVGVRSRTELAGLLAAEDGQGDTVSTAVVSGADQADRAARGKGG